MAYILSKQYGLNEQLLKNEVEQYLRRYGIQLFTEEELLKRKFETFSTVPTLFLRISPVIFDKQLVALFLYELYVCDRVFLPRERGTLYAQAITWMDRYAKKHKLDRPLKVQEDVKNLLGKFINDYFTPDPNQQATAKKDVEFEIDNFKDVKPELASASLIISAILYDANDSIAMIDGKIKRVGDTIHGLKITNIYKDRVEFGKNGQTWIQKIREGNATEPKFPPDVSDIWRNYYALLNEARLQSKTTLLSTTGQWTVYETTVIDGWVNRIHRGTIFKTVSGNIYEVAEPVIVIESELRPDVTVLTDGRFYKLLIDGVGESLLCRKLNSGSRESATTVDVVEARIIGVHDDILNLGEYGAFSGLNHGNIYKLDNGQIWEQVDVYIHVRVAVMPKVTIWRDGLIHKMKVEGIEKAVIVKQIK